MEIQLKDVAIKLTDKEGKLHMLKEPTFRILRDFQKSAKNLDADSDEMLDLISDLFEKCGLPKSVTESLTPSELEKIMSALTQKKS
jgi:hypothetical protein